MWRLQNAFFSIFNLFCLDDKIQTLGSALDLESPATEK